jgi:tripartite-type tricarboxylate transporter receptor subunit TctC
MPHVLNRRHAVLSLIASCAPAIAIAQSASAYPNKPIRVIVPFAGAGLADAIARALGQAAAKHLPADVVVVVENKPGAAGRIGISQLIASPPDGYTLAFAPMGPIAIQPHLGAPYALKDVQPVMRVTSVPLILAVRSDAPWRTLDEWLAHVKANPGVFNYATPGTGTNAHIAMEAIALELKSPMTHVPYQGNPQSINAVLGGHVGGTLLTAPDLLPFVESGKMRALANVGLTPYRASALESLPFLRDRGIGLSFDTMYGLLAPVGIPADVMRDLKALFRKALEDPSMTNVAARLKMPIAYADSAEFAALIEKESAVNGQILKTLKITQ